MKILVTGASGYLGGALATALEKDGHELTKLSSREADLTKPDALAPWTDERYDQIYHLAAWTQAGDFCLEHPGEQWIINQHINTNVITWWSERQPQAKLISIGSSCSYDPELPLSEENYLRGTPIPSLFTYAMTKRMLEAGVQALHDQFGLTYLTLVPSTLYGPGYHVDGRQLHFIFDLLRKIIRAARYGERVVLWGDGHQRRELIFIDDFVRAAVQLASSVSNELVNIGSGEEFSIRDFAQLICKKVGYDFDAIQFDTTRYVGARSKCLLVDKVRGCLPDLRLTPLEAGLDRTLQWIEADGAALISA